MHLPRRVAEHIDVARREEFRRAVGSVKYPYAPFGANFDCGQLQGIGSALMEHLMEVSRLRGCVKMELELHEGNFPAQIFYEKTGFRIAGRRRQFYDMGQGRMCDAILMERTL